MPHSRFLFGAAVFLASFLLFLVEPIAAKQLLPSLGGSAAVWITCLVFFQTALLVAYLYAHWLARRSHWMLHFALLALAVVSVIAWSTQTIHLDSTHPVTSIFLALGISIGLPFLMLGATSPLLQVWLARVETGVEAIPACDPHGGRRGERSLDEAAGKAQGNRLKRCGHVKK